MLHTLKYNGTQFSTIFTQHTRETRKNETVPRDTLVYPQLAETLLRTALMRGLTSFRDKGEVVVTARIGEEYAVSFLVNIDSENVITIQSILTHPLHTLLYLC